MPRCLRMTADAPADGPREYYALRDAESRHDYVAAEPREPVRVV